MSIIDSVIGQVGKLAGKFIKDKDKLAAFEHEMAMSMHNSDLAQIAVNAEEAKSPSIFVSGWRPAVGWVAVMGLAFNFIVLPLGNWACAIWSPEVVLPQLEIDELMTLLYGLLGMGALRSYDKKQGTARHKI
jgi:hypothetical protein